MTDGRRIPAQPGSQRAVSRRPDRQACRTGDGISYLGYGQPVGTDVLGEFGCTKPLEMFVQVLDRPAPAPVLSSQTAPGQPPPHSRRLSQQGEMAHREAILPQGADDLPDTLTWNWLTAALVRSLPGDWWYPGGQGHGVATTTATPRPHPRYPLT